MTKIREVSVEYGRTVTDGNFGSERVSVSLTATVGEADVAIRLAHDLCGWARDTVLAELRQSRSRVVREAVAAHEEGARTSEGD